MTWRDQAACRGSSNPAFVDARVLDDQQLASEALKSCRDCPVTQKCGAWATEQRFTGIAGGRVFKNGKPLTDASLRTRASKRRARREAAS